MKSAESGSISSTAVGVISAEDYGNDIQATTGDLMTAVGYLVAVVCAGAAAWFAFYGEAVHALACGLGSLLVQTVAYFHARSVAASWALGEARAMQANFESLGLCAECDAQIARDAMVCPNCGASIAAPHEPALSASLRP